MEDGGRRNSRGDGLRAGRNQRQKKKGVSSSHGYYRAGLAGQKAQVIRRGKGWSKG